MKLICNKTTSENFDLNYVNTISTNKYDYSYGGSGLEMGKEYFPMGLAIYHDSSCLYYLIDTDGRPHWFPYLLFNITNNQMPNNWFTRINPDKNVGDLYFICGFDELCNEKYFYDNLMEREKNAMEIYFKRKIELEIQEQKRENYRDLP